nr:MAG TPA: hypothetical protein [Caudoviricetes sp.]
MHTPYLTFVTVLRWRTVGLYTLSIYLSITVMLLYTYTIRIAIH